MKKEVLEIIVFLLIKMEIGRKNGGDEARAISNFYKDKKSTNYLCRLFIVYIKI